MSEKLNRFNFASFAAGLSVVFWLSSALACSDLRSKCTNQDFKNNIRNAKYIVVAQLDKYLPDNKGEFTVLINLRGSIQPGTKIVQEAIPRKDTNVFSSCGNGMKLGADILFMGVQYEQSSGVAELAHYECNGRYGVGILEGEWRAVLPFVIDSILDNN